MPPEDFRLVLRLLVLRVLLVRLAVLRLLVLRLPAVRLAVDFFRPPAACMRTPALGVRREYPMNVAKALLSGSGHKARNQCPKAETTACS